MLKHFYLGYSSFFQCLICLCDTSEADLTNRCVNVVMNVTGSCQDSTSTPESSTVRQTESPVNTDNSSVLLWWEDSTLYISTPNISSVHYKNTFTLKGLDHTKQIILSSFTHPQTCMNFFLRYFEMKDSK